MKIPELYYRTYWHENTFDSELSTAFQVHWDPELLLEKLEEHIRKWGVMGLKCATRHSEDVFSAVNLFSKTIFLGLSTSTHIREIFVKSYKICDRGFVVGLGFEIEPCHSKRDVS
jgi:hypothetical protein